MVCNFRLTWPRPWCWYRKFVLHRIWIHKPEMVLLHKPEMVWRHKPEMFFRGESILAFSTERQFLLSSTFYIWWENFTLVPFIIYILHLVRKFYFRSFYHQHFTSGEKILLCFKEGCSFWRNLCSFKITIFYYRSLS